MKLHVFYIKSAIWVPLPLQLMRQPKMFYLTLRPGDCSSASTEDGLMSLFVCFKHGIASKTLGSVYGAINGDKEKNAVPHCVDKVSNPRQESK